MKQRQIIELLFPNNSIYCLKGYLHSGYQLQMLVKLIFEEHLLISVESNRKILLNFGNPENSQVPHAHAQRKATKIRKEADQVNSEFGVLQDKLIQ